MRRMRVTGSVALNGLAVYSFLPLKSLSLSIFLPSRAPQLLVKVSLRPMSTTSSSQEGKKRRSIFKMSEMYKPWKFTSKDLPKGPSGSNQPWDPVFAHYAFHKVTGPLKRKQNTTPDDHLTVDELDKWMDAKAAAKVLGIKEKDLPTLTSSQVEERWAKAYGQCTNAQQQETVIAAEVLLEYIDSSLHRKKSRQYYRKYVDNARNALDHETELRRSDHKEKIIYIFGIAMFTGCAVVLCIALFRNIITFKDVENIGESAVSYLRMTFAQPTNPEPAPDYATRYRDTPSAMEIDQQEGVYGQTDPTQAQVKSNVEKYRLREEEEILRIFNDENELARKEARMEQLRNSRIQIYRREDFDESGELKEPERRADDKDPAKAFSEMTFRQFASFMGSQFGGGSRFQRITQDSVQRAKEFEAMQKRMNDMKL